VRLPRTTEPDVLVVVSDDSQHKLAVRIQQLATANPYAHDCMARALLGLACGADGPGPDQGGVMKSRNSTGALAVVLTILGLDGDGCSGQRRNRSRRSPGTAAGNPIPGLTADQAALFQIGLMPSRSGGARRRPGPALQPRRLRRLPQLPRYRRSFPGGEPQVAAATAFGARNVVPAFISANGPIREARFKFRANGARDGGVHSLFVISGRLDNSGSAGNCDACRRSSTRTSRAAMCHCAFPLRYSGGIDGKHPG